jgi:hypothetical protein
MPHLQFRGMENWVRMGLDVQGVSGCGWMAIGDVIWAIPPGEKFYGMFLSLLCELLSLIICGQHYEVICLEVWLRCAIL